jgi:RNA polymerase sigma-70 factor (ECF subfamily)
MSQDHSFADLMDRLRRGDADAASEIFSCFAHRLIGLARTRLDRLLRQKLDPEDVVQSVFRSFFERHVKGQLDLPDRESLWGLLTVITLRKCGHRIEYFQTERRNLRREVVSRHTSDDSRSSFEAIARDPTPSEAAILAEMVEKLIEGLEGRDRQIVELRLQGYVISEISAQVHCTERTVSRVLERVKKRLERLQSAEVDA